MSCAILPSGVVIVWRSEYGPQLEFVPVFYTTSSNGEDVGSAVENAGFCDF